MIADKFATCSGLSHAAAAPRALLQSTLPAGATAQQATLTGPLASRSGRSTGQGSKASGQRGWNGQPEGGLIGDGSSPSSLMRPFGRVGSAIGVAERRARV